MTWRDVTWRDVTWRDVTCHDMTWHDMTWHDMTQSLTKVKVLTYSKNFPHSVEPESSLPCWQQLDTYSYPQPDQSNPHLPFQPLKTHFNIIFPSTPMTSNHSLSFRFLNLNPVCICLLSHPCNMPPPSHPSWFDHMNYIWWSVQTVKVLIIECSVYILAKRHAQTACCPPNFRLPQLIFFSVIFLSCNANSSHSTFQPLSRSSRNVTSPQLTRAFDRAASGSKPRHVQLNSFSPCPMLLFAAAVLIMTALLSL